MSCLAINLCTSKVVDRVAVPQVARCHGLCERFCNRVLEVPATWIPSALSERVGAQLFRVTKKKVSFLRQKNAVVRNLINDIFLRPKIAEKKCRNHILTTHIFSQAKMGKNSICARFACTGVLSDPDNNYCQNLTTTFQTLLSGLGLRRFFWRLFSHFFWRLFSHFFWRLFFAQKKSCKRTFFFPTFLQRRVFLSIDTVFFVFF